MALYSSTVWSACVADSGWISELVLAGQDLISWTQRLLLGEGRARRWEPKRLRYRLLHVAGRPDQQRNL